MEKFYLEEPSILRKDEAIDYINEHLEYNSAINGSGGLNKFINKNICDYEGWIAYLENMKDKEYAYKRGFVPTRTYFLIREDDDKIIGMINIRLELNDYLKKYGGHIGYGIRPTERGKGYNKINLYLGLKVCDSYGIDKVFMDADLNNPASWKTMEALGGKRIREYYDDIEYNCEIVDYNIDVKDSLEKYASIYEDEISKKIR